MMIVQRMRVAEVLIDSEEGRVRECSSIIKRKGRKKWVGDMVLNRVLLGSEFSRGLSS
jgi:hypothetical protein